MVFSDTFINHVFFLIISAVVTVVINNKSHIKIDLAEVSLDFFNRFLVLVYSYIANRLSLSVTNIICYDAYKSKIYDLQEHFTLKILKHGAI